MKHRCPTKGRGLVDENVCRARKNENSTNILKAKTLFCSFSVDFINILMQNEAMKELYMKQNYPSCLITTRAAKESCQKESTFLPFGLLHPPIVFPLYNMYLLMQHELIKASSKILLQAKTNSLQTDLIFEYILENCIP